MGSEFGLGTTSTRAARDLRVACFSRKARRLTLSLLDYWRLHSYIAPMAACHLLNPTGGRLFCSASCWRLVTGLTPHSIDVSTGPGCLQPSDGHGRAEQKTGKRRMVHTNGLVRSVPVLGDPQEAHIPAIHDNTATRAEAHQTEFKNPPDTAAVQCRQRLHRAQQSRGPRKSQGLPNFQVIPRPSVRDSVWRTFPDHLSAWAAPWPTLLSTSEATTCRRRRLSQFTTL